MDTFKITNITNFLGKRDAKANSTLDIVYIDNMTKKTVVVKPNESIYLTIQSLPLSVHRLRVKNLITVSVISESELTTLQNKLNSKKNVSAKPKTTKKTIAVETKTIEPKFDEEDGEKYSTTGKRTKTSKKDIEE